MLIILSNKEYIDLLNLLSPYRSQFAYADALYKKITRQVADQIIERHINEKTYSNH